MDPDKVLKFFTEHLADWSQITFLTLINPIARFELVPAPPDRGSAIVSGTISERHLWISPKLIAYAVLSILLGMAMNSLLPNRISAPELFTAAAIILVYWFLYGSVLYMVCWMLRGCGSYLDTLSISIQVLATIYVVTSFVSLVMAAVVSVHSIAAVLQRAPIVGEGIVNEPSLVFFLIGTSLLSIYVPLSLKNIHRFGWLRTAVVILVPLIMVGLSLSIYYQTGVMLGSPR